MSEQNLISQNFVYYYEQFLPYFLEFSDIVDNHYAWICLGTLSLAWYFSGSLSFFTNFIILGLLVLISLIKIWKVWERAEEKSHRKPTQIRAKITYSGVEPSSSHQGRKYGNYSLQSQEQRSGKAGDRYEESVSSFKRGDGDDFDDTSTIGASNEGLNRKYKEPLSPRDWSAVASPGFASRVVRRANNAKINGDVKNWNRSPFQYSPDKDLQLGQVAFGSKWKENSNKSGGFRMTPPPIESMAANRSKMSIIDFCRGETGGTGYVPIKPLDPSTSVTDYVNSITSRRNSNETFLNKSTGLGGTSTMTLTPRPHNQILASANNILDNMRSPTGQSFTMQAPSSSPSSILEALASRKRIRGSDISYEPTAITSASKRVSAPINLTAYGEELQKDSKRLKFITHDDPNTVLPYSMVPDLRVNEDETMMATESILEQLNQTEKRYLPDDDSPPSLRPLSKKARTTPNKTGIPGPSSLRKRKTSPNSFGMLDDLTQEKTPRFCNCTECYEEAAGIVPPIPQKIVSRSKDSIDNTSQGLKKLIDQSTETDEPFLPRLVDKPIPRTFSLADYEHDRKLRIKRLEIMLDMDLSKDKKADSKPSDSASVAPFTFGASSKIVTTQHQRNMDSLDSQLITTSSSTSNTKPGNIPFQFGGSQTQTAEMSLKPSEPTSGTINLGSSNANVALKSGVNESTTISTATSETNSSFETGRVRPQTADLEPTKPESTGFVSSISSINKPLVGEVLGNNNSISLPSSIASNANPAFEFGSNLSSVGKPSELNQSSNSPFVFGSPTSNSNASSTSQSLQEKISINVSSVVSPPVTDTLSTNSTFNFAAQVPSKAEEKPAEPPKSSSFSFGSSMSNAPSQSSKFQTSGESVVSSSSTNSMPQFGRTSQASELTPSEPSSGSNLIKFGSSKDSSLFQQSQPAISSSTASNTNNSFLFSEANSSKKDLSTSAVTGSSPFNFGSSTNQVTMPSFGASSSTSVLNTTTSTDMNTSASFKFGETGAKLQLKPSEPASNNLFAFGSPMPSTQPQSMTTLATKSQPVTHASIMPNTNTSLQFGGAISKQAEVKSTEPTSNMFTFGSSISNASSQSFGGLSNRQTAGTDSATNFSSGTGSFLFGGTAAPTELKSSDPKNATSSPFSFGSSLNSPSTGGLGNQSSIFSSNIPTTQPFGAASAQSLTSSGGVSNPSFQFGGASGSLVKPQGTADLKTTSNSSFTFGSSGNNTAPQPFGTMGSQSITSSAASNSPFQFGGSSAKPAELKPIEPTAGFNFGSSMSNAQPFGGLGTQPISSSAPNSNTPFQFGGATAQTGGFNFVPSGNFPALPAQPTTPGGMFSLGSSPSTAPRRRPTVRPKKFR